MARHALPDSVENRAQFGLPDKESADLPVFWSEEYLQLTGQGYP